MVEKNGLAHIKNNEEEHSIPCALTEGLAWEPTSQFSEEAQSSECIKVIARFRPSASNPQGGDGRPCVRVGGDQRTCTWSSSSDCPGTTFCFDSVFEAGALQPDIYESVAAPIVDGVFEGFNGAILAYGQTGSGKTHTMLGPRGAEAFDAPDNSIPEESELGIVPRAITQLLSATTGRSVQLRASYIEVYQEQVLDLLGVDASATLVKDNSRQVCLPEVVEMPITSIQAAFDVLRHGNRNRHQAQTKMNRNSSRSHAIFVITVTTMIDQARSKYAQLYLVDLAGSERFSKTGAEKLQMEEAKKINLSLLALGQVINALANKKKHVPYRDSKLTQLLRNCLGGNARTSIVICASPDAQHSGETLSALKFGDRASLIRNVARVNVAEDPWKLQEMLDQAREDLNELRAHCRVLQTRVTSYQIVAAQPFAAGSRPDSSKSLASKASPASQPSSGCAMTRITSKMALVWSLLPSLICPITRKLMKDPVCAADGWTYDRHAITAHFSKAKGVIRSPVDGKRFSSKFLAPCNVVAQLIHLHFDNLEPFHTPLPIIFKIHVWLAMEVLSFLDARSIARAERASGFFVAAASQRPTVWETIFSRDFPLDYQKAMCVENDDGNDSSEFCTMHGMQNHEEFAVQLRKAYAVSWDRTRQRKSEKNSADGRFVAEMSKGLTLFERSR